MDTSLRRRFGTTPEGREVDVLRIGAEPAPVVEVLTLGATVHTLTITCEDGVRRNVVLGHPDVETRLASTAYVGSVVGRYANRIAGGRFELDGREVVVGTNDRGTTLHGGPDGFDRRVWDVLEQTRDRAVLELVSHDGDQGFPGTLTVRAAYDVQGESVRLELTATTDATTVANLTSHVYLNLAGEGSGTVDDHLLQVEADHYLPTDATALPTGVDPVDGTPFDLRRPTRLGDAARSSDVQVVAARGLDHCLVVRGDGLRRHAVVESSGTRVELWSDQPGLQVYTGNFLDGTLRSTGGGVLRQGDGLALEPQLFPDSPHHPEWPSAELRPGETYRSRIEWRLG